MKTSELLYHYPEHLIATEPLLNWRAMKCQANSSSFSKASAGANVETSVAADIVETRIDELNKEEVLALSLIHI